MATTKITSPDLFNLESLNTALKLPSGTTAQRPTSPSTGEWRYNTTTYYVEFWDGGEWRDLQSEEIPPINSENFNAVTYTGNSSTQSITGVGFKPDWVWIKERGPAAENHNLIDSTRGTSKILASNNSNAEFTSTRFTSFDADGFTLANNNETNDSGSTYVAWCWKAGGGTTSTNNDGSVTSTVQANTKAQFSVVSYTGTGANATVGHGLSSAPEIMIIKDLDNTRDWAVYSKYNTGASGNPAEERLKLNTSDATTTYAPYWNSTLPTATVFSLGNEGNVNTSGQGYIAYVFAPVAGYSSFGSYTGNGSTNGPIVNTGFEPAFVITKRSSTTGGWVIFSNKLSTANPRVQYFQANVSNAEETLTGGIDFLSNGFQLKETDAELNGNGDTFIYIAFAADASTAPTLADSYANKLYTGTGNDQTISGYNFNIANGSLLWVKSRNASNNWNQYDTIRGPKNRLVSNLTAAQDNLGGLDGFTSDGFTLRGGYDISQAFDYVTYAWKQIFLQLTQMEQYNL